MRGVFAPVPGLEGSLGGVARAPALGGRGGPGAA